MGVFDVNRRGFLKLCGMGVIGMASPVGRGVIPTITGGGLTVRDFIKIRNEVTGRARIRPFYVKGEWKFGYASEPSIRRALEAA